MLSQVQKRLAELGLELPEPAAAKGNYLAYSAVGDLLSVSGTLPIRGGQLIVGRVGGDLSLEQGYEAARWCILNAVAQIRAATDDFRRFVRIVHVDGFVNGVDGFADSPKVINGASDLLVELFGDSGRHTRVALSSNGLPLGAAAETRVLAEIRG